MNSQGMLSVESKNIFTILKKWLYAEQDIVFRELVSNAVDAIRKRSDLQDGEGEVRVRLDEEKRLLVIRDNGIGMSEEEVQKYINQIAFSGAEEFIRQSDGEGSDAIIGHFGVGFYSAFMLSDHVAIETKSAHSPAIRWDCTSEMEYQIREGHRSQTGTDVILQLEEGNPFLAKPMLALEALKKYFAFSRIPVFFEAPSMEVAQVSDPDPLWRKINPPEDALQTFYQNFFEDVSKPLLLISIVSADIGLQGMLFFRNTRQGAEELDGKVKIYSRGVYIGENIPQLVPKFVSLQNGIIECNDLPLVVSRGGIRTEESNVSALISECLSQEVSIALHEMFSNRRKEYEGYWPELNAFVKYGVMQDRVFASVMARKVIFEDLYGTYHTLGEYAEEGNVFYASDKLDQARYIQIFKTCGMNALLFDHVIDQPLMLRYETLYPKLRFIRIDSNMETVFVGSLEDGDEREIAILREKFLAALGERLGSIELKLTRLKHQSVSALILNDEKGRRMADMMEIYGYLGADDFAAREQQSKSTLLVNISNEVVRFMLTSSNEEAVGLVANQLFDLALMSQQSLRAEDVERFIGRSEALLAAYIKE